MLPNLWSLYNLRTNPYFQDTLRSAGQEGYPLSLFVGREKELERLLTGIGSGSSSRQLIAGPPGIGKTTLAQKVKEEAATAGYLTHPASVPVGAEVDAGALLVRVLSHVYEAILGRFGESAGALEAMAESRHLVRAFRVQGRSGGASAFGFGAQFGSSASHVPPVAFDPFARVPDLLEELARWCAKEKEVPGLIVHLNNLENLAGGPEIDRAAQTLRELRDVFLQHRFHWLVVGTAGVLEAVIGRHQQVASIFPTPESLAPLSDEGFQALIERRMEHLRLDADKLVQPPVSAEATRAVYALFQGDLRGSLRALQEATEALGGYGTEEALSPLAIDEVLQILQPRYAAQLDVLSDIMREQVHALAPFGDRPFSQHDLEALWGVTRGRVSQVLVSLKERDIVREVAPSGGRNQYRLTGLARVMLHAPPEHPDAGNAAP